MKNFKVGMIVQLKSGGPKMTIKNIDDAPLTVDKLLCQWFSGSKLQQGWFNPDSLIIIEEEEEEEEEKKK